MIDDLLNLLRCPACLPAGATAQFRAGPAGLACAGCGNQYLLRDGIPDLVGAAEPEAEAESRQWDEQAEGYDRRERDHRYMAGVEAAVHALGARRGELVLDAGCGTGLTLCRYLRPGVSAVGLDISHDSLRRLRAKVGPRREATLVRGDLGALPFADGTFDRVLCSNAVSQIADADTRARWMSELARVVRPGGRVVVTVQGYSLPRRRAGWRREGPASGHSGPVRYVRRFEPAELRAAVRSAGLSLRAVRGAAFGVPYRFKLTWLSRRAERLFWRLPLADWGGMLVAIARKPAASAEPDACLAAR